MRTLRSPTGKDTTKTRGPVKPAPSFVQMRLFVAELLCLDELPGRRGAGLEDRDEALLRIAVRVERHRADDVVADVRLEQLRDDVLTRAVGAADRVEERLGTGGG